MALGALLLVMSLGLWLNQDGGRFEAVIVDVVGIGLIFAGRFIIRFGNSDGDWRGDPASNKQKTFARDLGISFDPRITKGELSDRISHALGEEPADNYDD